MGGKGGGAAGRSWGECGAAAMAGDAKVAGVACYCATVRRFTNRMIREREEGEGSSFPSFARPGGARAARSMAGGHGVLRRTWPGG